MRPHQMRELAEDARFGVRVAMLVIMRMAVILVMRVAVILVMREAVIASPVAIVAAVPVTIVAAVSVAWLDVARTSVWVGHNAQDASPAGAATGTGARASATGQSGN
jgi:hypothetical protein